MRLPLRGVDAPSPNRSSDSIFDRSVDPVTLPLDELDHRHAVEWWYTAGSYTSIQDPSWRQSFMVTCVRVKALTNFTFSFFKITDHKKQETYLYESGDTFSDVWREQQNPIEYKLIYPERPLNVNRVGSWRLTGAPGRYQARLKDDNDHERCRLFMNQQGPTALFGDKGIVQYGHGHELAWYVRPGLEVTGSALFGGESHQVSGRGWFEHQWGPWLKKANGWKYVSFDIVIDGSYLGQISVFRSFVKQHVTLQGYAMWADDAVEQIEIEPTGFKDVSHEGRAKHGTLLSFATSKGHVEATVMPLLKERAIRSTMPLIPSFIEDASSVHGQIGGQTFEAYGMTEMHNHD